MSAGLIEATSLGVGILWAAFNVGIMILFIYILFYRIPKALIKFAIEKYFQERRMDMVYRQGSQLPPSTPPHQTGQQSHHHQE